MNNPQIRVRIAPSPTGDPHVGTAYIALFNYAFAKKNNGKFILRIEDTDRVRSTNESEIAIINSLKWLGLSWDEGPDIGGDYGPYKQSERLEIYNQYILPLLKTGAAYKCFCTEERLSELREKQKRNKTNIGYDKHCRLLSHEDIAHNISSGQKFVIRFAIPTTGQTSFVDEIHGTKYANNSLIDDYVLIKSDGYPTYHFANVIDDHLMQITHVIRAEEWLPSTPKHVLLYQAFGWLPPKYLHMPLLRNADKSKISKRKNPVSLRYYQDCGYLPEALLNFISNLGFSFGNNIEKFTLQEFINNFSIDKISLGGPVFDINKLNNLNGLYIRGLSVEDLATRVKNWKLNDEFIGKILVHLQPRISRLDQIIDSAAYFFNSELDYSNIILAKNKDMNVAALNSILDSTDNIVWNATKLHDAIIGLVNPEWSNKDLFMLLRQCITGRVNSPPLFEIMEILGRDICRLRIMSLIRHISKIKN